LTRGACTDKREALERSDFGDAQFTLDLLAKDLGLVLSETARDDTADMAVTRAALESAQSAIASGRGGEDYAALNDHVAELNHHG